MCEEARARRGELDWRGRCIYFLECDDVGRAQATRINFILLTLRWVNPLRMYGSYLVWFCETRQRRRLKMTCSMILCYTIIRMYMQPTYQHMCRKPKVYRSVQYKFNVCVCVCIWKQRETRLQTIKLAKRTRFNLMSSNPSQII